MTQDEERHAREDDANLERAWNDRFPKPEPVCKTCLQPVAWSKIHGVWRKFQVTGDTTELHRCFKPEERNEAIIAALDAWCEEGDKS